MKWKHCRIKLVYKFQQQTIEWHKFAYVRNRKNKLTYHTTVVAGYNMESLENEQNI